MGNCCDKVPDDILTEERKNQQLKNLKDSNNETKSNGMTNRETTTLSENQENDSIRITENQESEIQITQSHAEDIEESKIEEEKSAIDTKKKGRKKRKK